jgi:hypothetical protein
MAALPMPESVDPIRTIADRRSKRRGFAAVANVRVAKEFVPFS